MYTSRPKYVSKRAICSDLPQHQLNAASLNLKENWKSYEKNWSEVMNFLTVSSQQALFWISGERFHVYITTKICEQESDMFWSSPPHHLHQKRNAIPTHILKILHPFGRAEKSTNYNLLCCYAVSTSVPNIRLHQRIRAECTKIIQCTALIAAISIMAWDYFPGLP